MEYFYQLYMMHGFYLRSEQLVKGKLVSVLSFSNFLVYMLSLSFLVSVLSFSNQKPRVTNPMSILDISPMTDKKTHIIYLIEYPIEHPMECPIDCPIEYLMKHTVPYVICSGFIKGTLTSWALGFLIECWVFTVF